MQTVTHSHLAELCPRGKHSIISASFNTKLFLLKCTIMFLMTSALRNKRIPNPFEPENTDQQEFSDDVIALYIIISLHVNHFRI